MLGYLAIYNSTMYYVVVFLIYEKINQ